MGDEENLDGVRHAETPELAREALRDSVALIYKGQVEVAFREQTAGHNALLLFVHLALGMMEEQLLNAFKELDVKQAEVCAAAGTSSACRACWPDVAGCCTCSVLVLCLGYLLHLCSTGACYAVRPAPSLAATRLHE